MSTPTASVRRPGLDAVVEAPAPEGDRDEGAPGPARRVLHWLIAALVILTLGIGLAMKRVGVADPEAVRRVAELFTWHKSLGVLVGVLSVIRVGTYLAGRAHRPSAAARLEVGAAAAVQTYFLAALVTLPVLGLTIHFATPGAAPIFGIGRGGEGSGSAILALDPAWVRRLASMHAFLAYGVLAGLALHVAGAVKHAFIDRDGALERMLLPRRARMSARPPEPQGRERLAGRALGFAGVALVLLAAAILPRQALVSSAPAETAGLGGGEMSRDAGLGTAAPHLWTVQPEQSRLAVRFTQFGEAVEAAFGSFAARVVFDPSLETPADIEVQIRSDSFTSGLEDRDKVARGEEWFNAAAAPLATFRSQSATRGVAEGLFELQGVLTIRGREFPVAVPFRFDLQGDQARATGEVALDRRVLGLASGSWSADDVVGFRVDVRFELVARRAVGPSGAGGRV